MIITFWAFDKRSNSTKRPDMALGSGLNCQLKDDCSIIAPVLEIRAMPENLTPLWNYCFIPPFSRYYFINNWTWKNGIWEIECVEDVLASFKMQIGNMSEYVVRAASEADGSIIDMEYPTTALTEVHSRILTNIFPMAKSWAQGYWVIGVINNNSQAAQGAVTYYQMTAAQMATLKAYMMSDNFIQDIGLDLPEVAAVLPSELLKTMYDPFKYIASCVWVPMDFSYIPSGFKTLENVSFGWWTPEPGEGESPIQGYRINANGYITTQNYTVNLEYHPQRIERGMFTDHSPFTDRMLYYPCFGSIPLNDDSINGSDRIRLDLTVDSVFGDAVLEVFHERLISGDYLNVGLLSRQYASLAVPIQLAQTSVDVFQTGNLMLTNAASGLMNSFAKHARGAKSFGEKVGSLFETLADIPSVAMDSIGDAIQNPIGQLQTSGQSGSRSALMPWPYIVEKFRIIADDDVPQKGKPLCKVRTISSLSGFIMVDSPDVSINCSATERQQIASFMASGFFYE